MRFTFLGIRFLAAVCSGAMAATGLAAAVDGQPSPRPAYAAPAAVESGDDRVARIGFRLISANAARCPRTSRPTGLRLHALGSYAAADRPAVSLQTGLGSGFGVLGVVPGSPAAGAGIQPGDEIIGVGPVDATTFRLDANHPTASHDRVGAFLDLMDREATNGALILRWTRGGQQQHATLSVPPGCPARFVLIADRDADAWTDGHHVAITTALADLLDDDELAFALGHELAHVILDHAQRPPGALATLGIRAGRVRDEERAADAFGVRLAAMAGFKPDAAARFLIKLGALRDTDHSFTHPSGAVRIAAVRAAAHELEAGRQ